jgi:hypothetical protein
VEGLHTVGGIISKISINCVLIYMLCIYTCVYVYGFFLCMLHVYFYCYFHMNVVQVMINNVVIGKIPMERQSTLVWIPFESHHIDLMWISSPWSWPLRRLEF